MLNTVLVLLPLSQKQKKILQTILPNWQFIYSSPKEIDLSILPNITIIIGNIPISLLKNAINLKWLQLNSAGAEEYLKEGVLPSHVILTNASGAYGTAVSEHMLALTFALTKNLHYYRDFQNQCLWKDYGKAFAISKSHTLVIGLGDIGTAFAKKMAALGSTVFAIKRNLTNKPEFIEHLYSLSKLERLLPSMDIIALCLPSSAETNQIFTKKQFSLMKSSAIILNAGRGNAINTQDLCYALEKQIIAGAALDVITPEPLPAEHKLWKLPNVIITPHVAGGFHLDLILEEIFSIVIENLTNYKNGCVLKNRI